MYHVSAQGVDERMINVHYYYYYKETRKDANFRPTLWGLNDQPLITPRRTKKD